MVRCLRANSLEGELGGDVQAGAGRRRDDIGWGTRAVGGSEELELTVRTVLLEEENASALLRQKLAVIAVDVLLLRRRGRAVGVGVRLERSNVLELDLRSSRGSHEGEGSDGGGELHFERFWKLAREERVSCMDSSDCS